MLCNSCMTHNKLRQFMIIPSLVLLYSVVSSANVVGTDAQNFNTTTNGLDFVTVHSSETLKPGVLNVGTFINYSRNTFAYLELNTREGSKASDSLTSADVNFGIGLAKNWDVGISFPFLLATTDNSTEDRVILKDQGLTEVRVNSKYRLSGDDSGGTALIGSVNMGLIRNDPYAGEGAGPTFNLEFAADTTLASKFAVGGNLGYRLRSPGSKRANFPVEPRGNQIIGSGALSYLFTGTDTKVITELFGSWPQSQRTLNTDRSQTTFEWLLGLKHDASRNLAIHAGGGTKLANGVASPDWRVYAGLNYVFGPLWGEPKPLIRKVTPQYKIDDDGPGEAVLPFWQEPVENTEVFIADEILFGFGSDRMVNQGARDALAQLNDHMEKPPQYRYLVIEGHTDSIGSEAYNKDLSQRRANNIRKYMVENLGVDPKKVKAVGIGEERPIADNGNFQGRAKNRRVEFKVFRDGSKVPEEFRR